MLLLAALCGCASTESTKGVDSFCRAIEGEWRGPYELWLMPGSPVDRSESSARVSGKEMSYEWAQNGKAQKGTFTFGGTGAKADFNWSDTFHTTAGPMKGEGALSVDGRKLIFKSTYGPAAAPWGWRTEFTIGEGGFTMEAYNLTPKGEEALAVRCRYARK
jgi:hypothetical protein